MNLQVAGDVGVQWEFSQVVLGASSGGLVRSSPQVAMAHLEQGSGYLDVYTKRGVSCLQSRELDKLMRRLQAS